MRMSRSALSGGPRRVLLGLVFAIVGALAMPSLSAADPPATVAVQGVVDGGLCGFPIQVTLVDGQSTRAGPNALVTGLAKVVVTNLDTGQTATVNGSAPYTVDSSGTLRIWGDEVFAIGSSFIPYVRTSGPLSITTAGVVSSPSNNAKAIDPCALVGPAPVLTPGTTPAPWGLPANALSHMAYAGLIPIIGSLVRHDHVHLDVIVNGQAVTVPAGIGMAEPFDFGPCSPFFNDGDCATGNIYDGLVADSPLHTHSTSGIIHIESDRPGEFTLGQFFDAWGVRLNQSCVGGYCTGGGEQLRVYVNGSQVTGDPRSVVLLNEQEIAVIYGDPGAFNSVPSTYTGGWPSGGCGGIAEPPC